jgi:hypothetical protein
MYVIVGIDPFNETLLYIASYLERKEHDGWNIPA